MRRSIMRAVWRKWPRIVESDEAYETTVVAIGGQISCYQKVEQTESTFRVRHIFIPSPFPYPCVL